MAFIGNGLKYRKNLSAVDRMDKFTLESGKGGDALAFLVSYLTAGKRAAISGWCSTIF